MAGDASFASVSTLLHADAEPLIDEAAEPKTYTAGGSAVVSGTAKFGAGAMGFSGGNSYFLTQYHEDFDFGTEAFTVECFFRATSLTGDRTIYAKSSNVNGIPRETSLYFASNTQLKFYYGVRGSSSTVRTFDFPTINTSQWYHLAFVRDDDGDMRAYIDGTESTTGAINDAADLDGVLPFYIGAFYTTSAINPWDGYIDELRITKGIARYSGDFTAPSAPFMDGIASVEGVIYNSAGVPAQRTVRCYDRSTGALVGETLSDATTGEYVIYCPTVDEVQRIVLDDAVAPLLNDLIDRVIPE